MAIRARDIMTRHVITIDVDAPLHVLMALISEHHVSGLPVVEGERVVGIVTEGDIIRRVRPEIPWYRYLADGTWIPFPVEENDEESLRDKLNELRNQPVRKFMTPRLVSVDPDADLREVARVLTDHRIKRVVVIEEGRLVGIISRGDVVRGMLRSSG